MLGIFVLAKPINVAEFEFTEIEVLTRAGVLGKGDDFPLIFFGGVAGVKKDEYVRLGGAGFKDDFVVIRLNFRNGGNDFFHAKLPSAATGEGGIAEDGNN